MSEYSTTITPPAFREEALTATEQDWEYAGLTQDRGLNGSWPKSTAACLLELRERIAALETHQHPLRIAGGGKYLTETPRHQSEKAQPQEDQATETYSDADQWWLMLPQQHKDAIWKQARSIYRLLQLP